MSILTSIDTLSPKDYIIIKGARIHNLKNLSVAIPRNKLVVITGLSGSGKSSLAFDTLYAEGQRRYVESLSSYARQFLGRLDKPDVDYIKGISPAIAIEQKVNTNNTRSTVGTSTEIYDYLKLLFARIGKTFSPVSGVQVQRDTVENVVEFITKLEENSKLYVLAPFVPKEEKSEQESLELLLKQGFTRIKYKGELHKLNDFLSTEVTDFEGIYLVIDRVSVKKDESEFLNRISDSIQTAFYEGEGTCLIETIVKEGEGSIREFSNLFELDGIAFEEPSVNLFSFNNPIGACKTCEGFGSVLGIDENLVIPNKNLSVFEDAIVCWKGEKMSEWKKVFLTHAHKIDFPVHRSYYELTNEEQQLLWTGNEYFEGLNDFFKFVEDNSYKIQYRVMLSRYKGKTVCGDCRGTRLRKDASYVKINNLSISDMVLLPIDELVPFFENLELSEFDAKVAKRLLVEIQNRLEFMTDVGLGYLTLNRLSSTLSGGESQRINLAKSLGSSLVGSMYVLDEPSIGLHSRDTQRLLKVLTSLREIGNTVIVVEHDEEIMRAADEIIDIGPLAGTLGGNLIFQGDYKAIEKEEQSLTALYLTGKKRIEIPAQKRSWNNYIELQGVTENNLKDVDVKFPLNVMTVVTGVSGSGKTSLIKRVLYPALKKIFGGYGEISGAYTKLHGSLDQIEGVEFIDQNPIGKSSRSNPVTYVKAYDDIRTLFTQQPLAQNRGYKPSNFSFNVDGGRCEVCEGDGEVQISMQFMADIQLVCDGCKGKRFKEEILEVMWNGKNISDVLRMTVDDAIAYFQNAEQTTTLKKINQKLQSLSAVGLGYVNLGQSSSTLSGGEAQRIKLASFLTIGQHSTTPTLFVFDEPTTGLHFHDIAKLLDAFNALIEKGHSIIIIEHNADIIKSADWVIDLGPEGGNGGGSIVFEGTPEDLRNCKESYTGQYLGDNW